MALNINTNIAALRAQNKLNKTSQSLQKSLERLSSGLRINWAADDAAGLAIADGLKMTATGLGQAIRNANEGISLIKVADGALIEYGNILNTLKEKVTQAANATQNAETRKSIQRDINKLLAELNNIARTTEFNGQKLLSGSFVNKKFQIGSASYVTASLSIRSAETSAVGATKTAVMDLNTIGEVQLTLKNASTGQEITIDPVNLQFNNNPDNGAGALANEINRFSGVTGISAVAVVESTSDQIQAGTIKGLKINGVLIGDVTVSSADADGALQAAINAKNLETGVTATVTEDGKLVLTSTDGRAIKVEADSGLTEVLGKPAQQLSTLGHIRVIQKGVTDFEISGLGGKGVGASMTANAEVTIAGTSTLAAGSTIATGSVLTQGTVLGGDATLRTTMNDTSDITRAEAGSVIQWGSTLAKGTVLGGDITVAGNYQDVNTHDSVDLEQDMLIKAGSVLKAGTKIGEGTVAYGSLAKALGVADGTVVGAATLSDDVTLDTDIVLKYNNSDSANTKIAAGSTISAGSILGADFTIGYTWDAGNTTTYTAAATGVSTTADGVLTSDTSLTLTDATTTGDSGTITLKSGSLLQDGATITFSPNGTDSFTISVANSSDAMLVFKDSNGTSYTAYDGHSLTFDSSVTLTLQTDTYLDGDVNITFNSDATSGGSLTVGLKSDSYLANGTGATADGTNVTYAGGITLAAAGTTSSLTSTDSMEIQNGSILVNDTQLKSGSILGEDVTVAAVTVNQDMTLANQSKLASGSVIARGSVVDTDSLQINGDTTLQQDTVVGAGSVLKAGTMLAKGTIVQQDLTLYTAASGGTPITVYAGTTLDQDYYIQSDTALTADMLLAKGSVLKTQSDLVLNPTGSMGQVETKKLSDLNVLDYESAQIALTIVEAAISDIDGIRAELGSVQNQLQSTVANISVTKVNVQAAESAIREVDFAEESANFTKMQVLMQAGMFALAQSNTIPQMAVQLLKG
ncbi:flagellin N-terminal helical domain-containing protein [Thermodesulfatator atlanticus]|uniref:flagellin N-terminal helical domain-containing protein n=1 Tax=Thermodesulfatator atlanticus TaxID=501497 RepID=UPI0003B33BB3|nr:flagellin [Thermodesulfatator atlanticus]